MPGGVCEPLSDEEAATLKGILPCIKSVSEGIDKKPTVQFSGCNVQIVNGEGKTESTNGAGNLVIGYDEGPGAQTGSHNLVLGVFQTFTSNGGILAGRENSITDGGASVLGGRLNTASGELASVSGGSQNTASADRASVSGGEGNTASGSLATVTGGVVNTASGQNSSVSGGNSNTAKGSFSSVSGGVGNTASGQDSSVSGGASNIASGVLAAVGGGVQNVAIGGYSWIGGGFGNSVFSAGKTGETGEFASIFGGKENKTAENYAAIP